MRLAKIIPGPAVILATAFFAVPALAQRGSPSPSNGRSGSQTAASPSSSPPDSASSSPSNPPSISNTGSSASATSATNLPSITGGPSSTSTDGGLTGFPTLTGPGVIPTYPPPSVPPTNNAPFMKQSTLPDGTVFIVVGAILGALGLALLLWRSIVSLMLHRSVERATMGQHDADHKLGFPAPPAPFYKYTDQASSPSLNGGGLGATSAGRGVRRTNRGPIPSATPSQSNLFFSPTAGAGAGAAVSRASSFLPSGFYAAGNSSPGGGANQTTSISLSNLVPDSRGHYTSASRSNLDVSPPDSPLVTARRDASSSSLNVNLAPGQRAPSAYLDDLLTDDPSLFPPPHIAPSSGSRRNDSPSGRF
ncbi:hypothetical protein AAL_08110 [Moelleriella libera RCEF 2490]|uniref:Uncharacterized protein n=1 Tax=Moelleriella libera RCEF 2490 TaxID=1081109 RepID=A0A167W352_9HYPO|nr:hypothetical protein AAL_08110 [Moelleriella libera RCEF 2490]